MTIQGTASAATTSVAIPAHAVGDLIFVFARAAVVPTKPTAGGTVPNWTIAQAAVQFSIGLSSAWAIATASNHTTGTWTNSTDVCVLVLRADTGKLIACGVSSTGSGNNTQNIVYPALTLSTLSGTSWGVRCGTRGGTGLTANGTAPTGWTAQIVEPAGAGALMSVHTRASLVANPTADTVTTTSSNQAYRAHTLEVTEKAGPQPMVTIA